MSGAADLNRIENSNNKSENLSESVILSEQTENLKNKETSSISSSFGMSLKQTENENVENSNENEENMSTKSNNSSLNLAQSAGSASKRNINVKIGSNQKSTNNRTNVVRKTKKNYKLNDEDDDEMLNDSDVDSLDNNLNDEYMPPKVIKETGSDGSDNEFSSGKRKSARLIKKPKILEEYDVDEFSNDSPIKQNQLQELDNFPSSLNSKTQPLGTKTIKSIANEPLNQQIASNGGGGGGGGPKQFARKSTAPGTVLSNSNQNFFINQQAPKRNQPVKYGSSISSTSLNNNSKLPVLTQIANGTTSNQTNSSGIKLAAESSSAATLSSTNVTTSTTTNQMLKSNVTQSTNTVKQFRNKIISCKPFCESKATECSPIVKDASTQVDLDEIKLSHTIVPVPVPIHVPLPLCMYQAPMPLPILVPMPIPVPIFIPTTKRTFNRVERKIQKLRKKLPSDPYEFEILLYAERLAREEGIEGFEESSDGESDSDQQMDTSSNRSKNNKNRLTNKFDQDINENGNLKGLNNNNQLVQEKNNNNMLNDQEGSFKWVYGVRIFNTWLLNKIEMLKTKNNSNLNQQRLPDDLIKLKNDELNILLAEFVHEIRKPTGEVYAPESVYYLCLGIQYYIQEKGRSENIFLDYHLFDKFHESLNEIALRYQIRINTEGHITSRIEEEILWESKQLGAFSPFVLLNTILYFNTKYFFLDKPESHLQLSFTNVKKHCKRNIGPNGEDYGKSVFLRYYPDFHGLEQVIYEQGENYDNPLRCPVELYNFYLSKCPDNVKNRSDAFYLLPEKASLPSSPVWFSSQPISPKMLERMLNRIKMVREVNELLIAALPANSSELMQ